MDGTGSKELGHRTGRQINGRGRNEDTPVRQEQGEQDTLMIPQSLQPLNAPSMLRSCTEKDVTKQSLKALSDRRNMCAMTINQMPIK